jgi:hypothetical protein
MLSIRTKCSRRNKGRKEERMKPRKYKNEERRMNERMKCSRRNKGRKEERMKQRKHKNEERRMNEKNRQK